MKIQRITKHSRVNKTDAKSAERIDTVESSVKFKKIQRYN